MHLAAVSNDPLGELAPKATRAVNYTATVDLARRAIASGVRHFVFLSSCSVYGATAGAPVSELAPTAPLSAYAKSKVDPEQDLLQLSSSSRRPDGVALRDAPVAVALDVADNAGVPSYQRPLVAP